MNAPEKAKEIKAAIAGLLALLTALWGWVGWAVLIWIGCVALDYLSGSAAAKAHGEWSSAQARAGLWHNLGEIFAVLVAALCDIALTVLVNGSGVELPIDIGPLVTPVVLLWYILTELGSIAENAGKLGAPVPKWLKASLEKAKQDIDEKQGGGEESDVSEVDTKAYQPRHDAFADPYEDIKKAIGYTDDADWDP